MSSRPETNFAERAEGLHQYFGWVVKELRKDDYRIGLELTQVWRDLIAREASIHDAIPFFVRVNRVYFSQHYLASGWFGFRCSVLSWVDSTWNNAQKGPTAEEIMLLAKAFEEYFEVVKRFPEAVSSWLASLPGSVLNAVRDRDQLVRSKSQVWFLALSQREVAVREKIGRSIGQWQRSEGIYQSEG